MECRTPLFCLCGDLQIPNLLPTCIERSCVI